MNVTSTTSSLTGQDKPRRGTQSLSQGRHRAAPSPVPHPVLGQAQSAGALSWEGTQALPPLTPGCPSLTEPLSDPTRAPGTACHSLWPCPQQERLWAAKGQAPTSLSTLSVAMHWLLAKVVISLLLGVSIRQLHRGTSCRPSTSMASGPLDRPGAQQTSELTPVLCQEKGFSPSSPAMPCDISPFHVLKCSPGFSSIL